MTLLEELKYKRKASLMVVCSFGLAATPLGLNAESNIFRGTSLDKGGMGIILKIISFLILTIPIAIIMFIIHIFKLIYYQIEITRLT